MGLRYVLPALIFLPILSAQTTIEGCPVFPADHIWNTPIDRLPRDPNSEAYIRSLGPASPMHPDFGAGLFNGGPIGIPFLVVPGSTPKLPAVFQYAGESDPGPYAVPLDAPIEGGPQSTGDRHAIALDRDNCILYELFDAHPQSGSWRAGSGAIYDLRSHALRPAGWTSADAAGLPIVPGLVRYDEVASGEIRHAIRFTVRRTRRAYIWPARHFASSITNPQVPPMGLRLRLRADYDISGFHPENQVILRALKKYGLILADNGSDLFISGAPDERWNNTRLRELRRVTGADFEAVDASSLMVDPNSGRARAAGASPHPAVVHAATYQPAPAVPGLIVSVFGAAFPEGVRILFDSEPAQILYYSPAQLNAVIPRSVSGRSTTRLRIVSPSETILESELPVATSHPGVFGVLNGDYSLNSESNPAPAGSIVVLYGTGGGLGADFRVTISGDSAQVIYGGAAPGFTGLEQLNIALPGLQPGRQDLVWSAAGAAASPFPVWVR